MQVHHPGIILESAGNSGEETRSNSVPRVHSLTAFSSSLELADVAIDKDNGSGTRFVEVMFANHSRHRIIKAEGDDQDSRVEFA